MSAINFAIAYRAYLERRQRSEIHPDEPLPDDHGLAPVRDHEGRRVSENVLAEPLRLAVWRDYEADVMKKVRGRQR